MTNRGIRICEAVKQFICLYLRRGYLCICST
nr:MAG TPA: hypothetical protein [Caudoviricetes sp.]